MAKPEALGQKDIAYLPGHRRAIIIAPDLQALRNVQTLLVLMI